MSVTVCRSWKSIEPGFEPRHQTNTPFSWSSINGVTVSRPPQALIVMASNPQMSNNAFAYASADGPISPRLASPIIIAVGAAFLMWVMVFCRSSNPDRPKAS